MALPDLTSPHSARAYLESSIFACSLAEPLSGGTANFLYRLHLLQPHNGQHTVVLKHAQPYVALAKHFPFSVERQVFEVATLQAVRSIIDQSTAIVNVPEVHAHDSALHYIVMSDCGSTSVDIKTLFKSGPVAKPFAEQIGRNLGEFLAMVHQKGSQNSGLRERLAKNKEAVRISAYATYGRLESTLTDAIIRPPESSDARLHIDRQLTATRIAEMGNATECVVMGDFWTVNVLVTPGASLALGAVHVVDWELAKLGIPGLDLGQFCAEMYLLQRFAESSESARTLATSFLRQYKAAVGGITLEFARTVAVHIGAHLVAWTPRAGWTDQEGARQIVEEGIEYLCQGYSGSPQWLEQSVVAELLLP